jgi:hypothetical protein
MRALGALFISIKELRSDQLIETARFCFYDNVCQEVKWKFLEWVLSTILVVKGGNWPLGKLGIE